MYEESDGQKMTLEQWIMVFEVAQEVSVSTITNNQAAELHALLIELKERRKNNANASRFIGANDERK